MRATFRAHGGNYSYWRRRWCDTPADTGELNLDHYPGKFALKAVRNVDGRILEAGCGAGRVLRHLHHAGKDIEGIDFIAEAVAKIKDTDPLVNVRCADITKLPFADGTFQAVLAF